MVDEQISEIDSYGVFQEKTNSSLEYSEEFT